MKMFTRKELEPCADVEDGGSAEEEEEEHGGQAQKDDDDAQADKDGGSPEGRIQNCAKILQLSFTDDLLAALDERAVPP